VDGSPVPSIVWQQPYQYKPLPSQLIAQQEMDKENNAKALMTDDVTLKTLSPSPETKVTKMTVLDGCGKGIMGSVQDTIFHSINSNAMKDVVESVIANAIENWLKIGSRRLTYKKHVQGNTSEQGSSGY
jgi:hypothetical protein